MSGKGVRLDGIRKTYHDGTIAVRGLDLAVAPGEFLTLLGPSGCGKTTTLRLVAGLESPSSGKITIGNADVTDIDPGDRDVAMVFQSYALYPHMTALENMTLALETRGLPRVEAQRRAKDVAEILGIQHLLGKKPAQLSGGQRQRVALGRAMVRRPACFLMDEPLSNVDLKLREKMRTELKRLHKELRVTTIYVTHDQSEALVLSDRIAVMKDGEMMQLASPLEIYERPSSIFVAEFVGSPTVNLLSGHRTAQGLAIGEIVVEATGWAKGKGDVWIGVRPEDLVVEAAETSRIRGQIEFAEPIGGIVYYYVSVEGWSNVIKGSPYLILGRDVHSPLPTGTRIGLDFRSDRLSVFDRATGIAVPRHG